MYSSSKKRPSQKPEIESKKTVVGKKFRNAIQSARLFVVPFSSGGGWRKNGKALDRDRNPQSVSLHTF
jgi:hypothetical protein